MSIKDGQRKARERYRKKVDRKYIEFYPTESDLKARIEDRAAAGEPMATYIKRLIREDIKRRG